MKKEGLAGKHRVMLEVRRLSKLRRSPGDPYKVKQKETRAVSEKAKKRNVTLQKGIPLQESNKETQSFCDSGRCQKEEARGHGGSFP